MDEHEGLIDRLTAQATWVDGINYGRPAAVMREAATVLSEQAATIEAVKAWYRDPFAGTDDVSWTALAYALSTDTADAVKLDPEPLTLNARELAESLKIARENRDWGDIYEIEVALVTPRSYGMDFHTTKPSEG